MRITSFQLIPSKQLPHKPDSSSEYMVMMESGMMTVYRQPGGRHRGAIGGAPPQPRPLQQIDPAGGQWL